MTRGVIGVQVRTYPLTKEDAQAFGLPNTNGAVLTTVDRGQAGRQGRAPAWRRHHRVQRQAGRRQRCPRGDGRRHQAGNHRAADGLPRPRPAAQVDEHHDRRARPRSRAGQPTAPSRMSTASRPRPASAWTIEPITPDIARELQAARAARAAPSSATSAAPARPSTPAFCPNDVILEVNRTPVTNVSQVKRELESAAPGSTVFIVVWRVGAAGGQETFLTLRKR